MGQITVFLRSERRRRWSDEERLKILNGLSLPAPAWPRLHEGVMCRPRWSTRGGVTGTATSHARFLHS
jgi:hypothetical protein